MKAWREFAMADPEDCDREWAAYLAVVNEKGTASVSSPTNPTTAAMASSATSSTGPLRVPCDTAPSANPTTSAASGTVLSAKHDSPKGDLSPEARRIYDFLVGDSVAPVSTASLHAPSSSAKDGLTLEARHIYDYLVGDSATPATTASEVSTVLRDPTSLNIAPIAADINATDLAATAPTTCSAECPSQGASVYAAALISSATPNSPMTTGGIISELAAPEDSDKVLDVDIMGNTAPMVHVYFSAGPDHIIGGEEVSMSLTLWSAPTSFNAPPGGSPSPPRAPLDVPEIFTCQPNTCLTICSADSINTMHFVFLSTHSSSSCLLPAAALAISKELMVQVRLSPSTFPAVSACGDALDADDTSADELFLDTEDMFPTAPMSSEVSTFQPLKLFSDRRFCAFVQWPPPLGMFVSLPMDFSEHDNQLQCKGREQCLIEGILVKVIISQEGGDFGFLENFIKEEKILVNIAAPNQATSWIEIQPMSQVWTVLLNDLNGGFSLEHLWDPGGLILLVWHLQQLEEIMSHTTSISAGISGQQSIGIELLPREELGFACASIEHSVDKVMEMFASPAITCELHYSSLVVENLLSAPYSSWCMRCGKLDIKETQECVLFLQPKPPWSCLSQTISTAVVEALHLIGNSFELNLLGVTAWYMFCARFKPREANFLPVDVKHNNNKAMSSRNYPPPSVDHVQLSSQCFFCTLQYSDGIMDITAHYHGVWISHGEIISSTSASVGQDCNCETFEWEISIHIWQCHGWVAMKLRIDGFQGALLRGYIMVGCFRSARNNELTQGHAADQVGALFRANETLLFPWDPGDYSASAWHHSNLGSMVDTCYCLGTDTSQMPWDPGVSSRDRLGGKPNFKGGGLSATILLYAWAGHWAGIVGPWPAQKLREALQIQDEVVTKKAGLELDGTAASAEG